MLDPIEVLMVNCADYLSAMVYFVLVFRMLNVYGRLYGERSQISSMVKYE